MGTRIQRSQLDYPTIICLAALNNELPGIFRYSVSFAFSCTRKMGGAPVFQVLVERKHLGFEPTATGAGVTSSNLLNYRTILKGFKVYSVLLGCGWGSDHISPAHQSLFGRSPVENTLQPPGRGFAWGVKPIIGNMPSRALACRQ